MSAQPHGADPGAQVVPLRAEDADTEAGLSHATPPAYVDTTDASAGKRVPIVPGPLRPGNLRGTLTQAAGLHWHRARYHGVRSPWYGAKTLAYAVRGAHRLTGRVLAWWHWTDGWLLESQAVAAGRAGHHDAMRAHTEGKKTRGTRGRIVAFCAAVTVIAVLVLARVLPWWVWPPLGVAAIAVLARHGKPHGKPIVQPAFIAPRHEKLTPDIIIRALGSLGVSGIDKVLREGREIAFIAPGPHRDGPGWRVSIDLPFGVTVTDIIERRDKLASGLRRPLGCVWPEAAHDEHAGRLVLYVCDEPLSRARQPAWPLLRAGKADLFSPIPFGTDQRGRPVSILLMFANLLIGSIPRQGKTVAMRNALLAAALDPTAELRVYELKGTGDLDMIGKVAHHFGSGADDETIEAALRSLQQVAEVELIRRAKVIRSLPKEECPESKVTLQLAARRSLRLHPLVFGLDECQEAFGHPEYGPMFARYCEQIIKRGPALGIILLLATQRPDKASLPTAISANASIRFCLRVMDQITNDLVLGTSAYKTGVRATLMTVSDKGCGYLVGASEIAQVVKTYNNDGRAAERAVARARVMREQAGTLSGYALGQDDDGPPRDFLGDVLSVFGASETSLHTETIATRLAVHIAGSYAGITKEAVASQLRALQVPVKQVREAGGPVRTGCEKAAVEAARETARVPV